MAIKPSSTITLSSPISLEFGHDGFHHGNLGYGAARGGGFHGSSSFHGSCDQDQGQDRGPAFTEGPAFLEVLAFTRSQECTPVRSADLITAETSEAFPLAVGRASEVAASMEAVGDGAR